MNLTGSPRSPFSYDVATRPDLTVEPIPHGDVRVDIPVNCVSDLPRYDIDLSSNSMNPVAPNPTVESTSMVVDPTGADLVMNVLPIC